MLALPAMGMSTNNFIDLNLMQIAHRCNRDYVEWRSEVDPLRLKRDSEDLCLLAYGTPLPQICAMDNGKGNGNGNGGRNGTLRTVLLVIGILLILLTPIVGALPGPGGIIVLAAGLALTLKNSNWAKRLYVRFKQRWPKYGRVADWSLRRKSYFRRLRRKEQLGEGDD